jgi:hypothetical protein
MYQKGDEINNGEYLLLYCRDNMWPPNQDEVPHAVFYENRFTGQHSVQELSTDLERIRKNPSTSFHVKTGKPIVVRLFVCDEIKNPRKSPRHDLPAWKQDIVYDPVTKEDGLPGGENLAHSLVKGVKKQPIGLIFCKHATWFKVDIEEGRVE